MIRATPPRILSAAVLVSSLRLIIGTGAILGSGFPNVRVFICKNALVYSVFFVKYQRFEASDCATDLIGVEQQVQAQIRGVCAADARVWVFFGY